MIVTLQNLHLVLLQHLLMVRYTYPLQEAACGSHSQFKANYYKRAAQGFRNLFPLLVLCNNCLIIAPPKMACTTVNKVHNITGEAM
jgi:hypothetical protein